MSGYTVFFTTAVHVDAEDEAEAEEKARIYLETGNTDFTLQEIEEDD